jgi:hypothetical protein
LIAEAEADMVRLREQLVAERVVRQQKLQYNEEVAKITRLPSRVSSLRTLQQLRDEKKQLEEDLQRAQRLVALRGRQLQAAAWALATLHEEMGVDPTDPTRPPALYYLDSLAPAAVPPRIAATDEAAMDGVLPSGPG